MGLIASSVAYVAIGADAMSGAERVRIVGDQGLEGNLGATGYVAIGAVPATAGGLRMTNAAAIVWPNAGGGVNISGLAITAGDALQVGDTNVSGANHFVTALGIYTFYADVTPVLTVAAAGIDLPSATPVTSSGGATWHTGTGAVTVPGIFYQGAPGGAGYATSGSMRVGDAWEMWGSIAGPTNARVFYWNGGLTIGHTGTINVAVQCVSAFDISTGAGSLLNAANAAFTLQALNGDDGNGLAPATSTLKARNNTNGVGPRDGWLTLQSPPKLPSFTVVQLNDAQRSSIKAQAGTMAYCSDESGGAVPVFTDGADWRRVTDRAVIS